MLISDWSSDLCSSDLRRRLNGEDRVIVMQAWSRQVAHTQAELYASMVAVAEAEAEAYPEDDPFDLNDVISSEIREDRKSVVSGTSVPVRGAPGGRRNITHKHTINTLSLSLIHL